MPTRDNVSKPFSQWRVCFVRGPTAAGKLKLLEDSCKHNARVKFEITGQTVGILTWVDSKCRYDNAHRHVCNRTASTRDDFSIVGVVSDVSDHAGEATAAPSVASSVAAVVPSSTPAAAVRGASSSPAASSAPASAACGSIDVPGLLSTERWPRLASLPLKLQLQLTAARKFTCVEAFKVRWDKKLGEGRVEVFEAVSMDDRVELAAKTFRKDSAGFASALAEAFALAAFDTHPCVLRLLDVAVINNIPCLATKRYEITLGGLLKKRSIEEVELIHILERICAGLSHLHQTGICHNDLKPANILLRACAAPPKDRGPTTEHARWMLGVKGRMEVCVADLGNAILGAPGQSPRLSEQHVSELAVNQVTLWYRAPEILLGLSNYSFPVDMWALGCVAAELRTRGPLLVGRNQVQQVCEIFKLIGTPTQEDMVRISGRSEPLLASSVPNFAPPEDWPPASLRKCTPALGDLLRRALVADPEQRITASESLKHELLLPRRLRTIISALPAGQGPASVQIGQVEPLLLSWLRAEPFLATFVKQSIDNRFQGGAQPGLKAEASWYARGKRPRTPRINKQDASKPCPGVRLARFVKEFCCCNREWLVTLTALVMRVLQGYPDHFLGENGLFFKETCFFDVAWEYLSLQVMLRGTRRDVPHFDGGASLLHVGFTLFGSRVLECWDAQGMMHPIQQDPGTIYVGNMCAMKHEVVHRSDSCDLYKGPDGRSYEISLMLRSDVFAASRARKMKGKPTPTEAYDLINAVVAQHIAKEPLILPTFAAVVGGAECSSDRIESAEIPPAAKKIRRA